MPCLETKSLLLRPLTLCDTRKVFQMSQEQAMKKWLPRQVYGDEAHASSVIAFLAAQYRADIDPRTSPYVLGIELKSTQELVGHVGLSPLHGEVEVGFAVEQSQQRKGIAPEAVLAMCEWFATRFPGTSVLGTTARENRPSQRVLLGARFKCDGEKAMLFQGVEQTVAIFVYSP
jgi:RimJ/RimL family protein N-acetyltransferase